MQLFEETRDLSASHNCYAYKIADEFRSSDDGEPGGTAGRPILAAIEGADIDAVCVMVTRYDTSKVLSFLADSIETYSTQTTTPY